MSEIQSFLQILILSILCYPCNSARENCALSEFRLRGDYVLGGLFEVHLHDLDFLKAQSNSRPEALHCDRFRFLVAVYHQIQVMRFAVDEINNSTSLLPNISLGYEIFDYCSITKNFPSVFNFLSTNGSVPVEMKRKEYLPKVTAVISQLRSTYTISIAPLLMSYLIPMVGYGATSAKLSNIVSFPSFFRSIPSDRYQVRLIVRLLQEFKWNWVAFIGGDDDYSRDALQIFVEEIRSADICLAYQDIISIDQSKISGMLNALATLDVRVVVLFANQEFVTPFLKTAIKKNIKKVWIASEAWSLNLMLRQEPGIETIGTVIGITIKLIPFPGFEDFVYNRMMNLGRGEACSDAPHMEVCSQVCPKCSDVGPQDLMKEFRTYNFNIYTAVYVVAHALHQVLDCGLKGCSKTGPVHPYMVFQKMNRVNFTLHNYSIAFDDNGDLPAWYEIVFWDWTSSASFKKIGSYSSDENPDFILHENLISWHTNGTVPVSVCSSECKEGYKRQNTEVHKCCFDCEVCPNGTYINYTADPYNCISCEADEWSESGSSSCMKRSLKYLYHTELVSIGLMLSAGFLFILSVSVTVVFALNCNTPVVKSAGGNMCFFMLICLCTSCSSVFFYIGAPKKENCILRNTMFAVFYTACLTCLAIRSFQIVCVFKMAAKLPKAYNFWVKHNGQWLIIVACVVIQIILCAVWIAIDGPQPFNDTAAFKGQIVFVCNMGNLYAFAAVIAFIGFLSIACFIFSYLGTDLPKNYNEAKFITFSLLVFFFAWVSYMTAYVVYKGKYIQAINAVSVLASLYGILFGYFIPKCYIILFSPEKNTPAHFQNHIQTYTQRISTM